MAKDIGLKQLTKNMQKFEDKVHKRANKIAITAVTKAVARDAKSLVREETGTLKRSIGRKVKVYRNTRGTGRVVGIVGPRRGFDRIGHSKRKKNKGKSFLRNPIRYGHLIEKGQVSVR